MHDFDAIPAFVGNHRKWHINCDDDDDDDDDNNNKVHDFGALLAFVGKNWKWLINCDDDDDDDDDDDNNNNTECTLLHLTEEGACACLSRAGVVTSVQQNCIQWKCSDVTSKARHPFHTGEDVTTANYAWRAWSKRLYSCCAIKFRIAADQPFVSPGNIYQLIWNLTEKYFVFFSHIRLHWQWAVTDSRLQPRLPSFFGRVHGKVALLTLEWMWVEWHSVYWVTNSLGTWRVSLFSEVTTAIGRSCSSHSIGEECTEFIPGIWREDATRKT